MDMRFMTVSIERMIEEIESEVNRSHFVAKPLV
jgi:hypothetical protein